MAAPVQQGTAEQTAGTVSAACRHCFARCATPRAGRGQPQAHTGELLLNGMQGGGGTQRCAAFRQIEETEVK